MKLVIIGGVAGGMSAATRLRRLMEEAEIVVLEKGPFVSFANCGLPFHLSGEIAEREQLFVQTPASLHARFRLDVRPMHEVIAIDPIAHTVTVQTATEIYTETYDRLLLSPGANPIWPEIEGIQTAKQVYRLRNVPDLDQILNAVTLATKEAVIVGAGFIGLEVAENLRKKGLEVTLIERANHVLPPLDEEMAAYIQQALKENGVRVLTGEAVVRFADEGHTLVLASGQQLTTDLTILSVGVQPANTLAKQAGLALGVRGGILVNDSYQTSQPDIYAVGDAIVVKQQITGEDTLISLASPANRQGRQVADVLAGYARTNRGSIGTAIVRVFHQTAATTGLSERAVKQAGLPVKVVHVSGKDHAGYYPGATDMMLKLIFDPISGKMYGAQGVGEKGIDKRIDILATAIKGELTIFDLPELELTYAPPFGSAKDPVNMLGYAAMNLAEGLSDSIQWYEVKEQLAQGKRLLDVRNATEFAQGTFPGSIQIPLNELRERLAELDPNQAYIVSCHSGLRSYVAERLLQQNGFTVQNLDGAFALYRTVLPEELTYV